MSFKIILMGIVGMFGSFMLFAMIILNFMPADIYIYASTAIGIIFPLTLAILAILLNGIAGPFLGAKSKGSNLIASITASKNIRLLTGPEEGGMTHTKDGYFLNQPDATFTWPNGVKGGFAYYKYGSTLHPKFVKAASVMKKTGIKDIRQLGKVTNKVREKGQDLIIRLD